MEPQDEETAPVALTVAQLQSHSLSGVVQHEIERAILTGELPAGTRLNENALATKLGVSRGPIREACRALAEIGLVRLVPNRGVFIQHMDQNDANEVYDLRAGLVALAGRLLAPKITDAEIARLKGLLQTMERAAAASDFASFARLNLDFHDFIVSAAGNLRLTRTYRALVKEFQLFRMHGPQSEGLRDSYQEHCAIVAALEARDPAASYEIAFAHVVKGKARMLATLREAPRQSNLAGD